jgi:hypothetical protein
MNLKSSFFTPRSMGRASPRALDAALDGLMMQPERPTDRKKRWVFLIGQQYPRPLDSACRFGSRLRDRSQLRCIEERPRQAGDHARRASPEDHVERGSKTRCGGARENAPLRSRELFHCQLGEDRRDGDETVARADDRPPKPQRSRFAFKSVQSEQSVDCFDLRRLDQPRVSNGY